MIYLHVFRDAELNVVLNRALEKRWHRDEVKSGIAAIL